MRSLVAIPLLFVLLRGSAACKAPVIGPAVDVWVTTSDQAKRLQQEAALRFEEGRGDAAVIVAIDETKPYQSMDGFGASLTESSAALINGLSPSAQGALLDRLFSPTEGIGLSFLRQPMGASDFALGNYSYDDTCCDVDDFSIAREQAHVIPVLRRIRAINPDLLIMGSPWSPPGWMKTSGSMVRGRLREEHYGALAAYFVRWIQAYEGQGLPVYAVTPQNEPQYEPTGYPGMLMTAAEQATFIRRDLGPALRAAGLRTKIVAFDHNWDIAAYALTVLGDPEAKAFVAGTGFHCYGGSVAAQSAVHDAHPDRDIWHTECSDGTWIGGGSFGALFDRDMRQLVIGAVRHWAKGVVKWNLALDRRNGPTNGGCTTCHGTITIDPGSEAVTYNAEYYALGHASKFVRRGAVRVGSDSFAGGVETVAFRNPDGGKVLVTYNGGASAAEIAVRWAGQSFAYTLPSRAAATFVWSQ